MAYREFFHFPFFQEFFINLRQKLGAKLNSGFSIELTFCRIIAEKKKGREFLFQIGRFDNMWILLNK